MTQSLIDQYAEIIALTRLHLQQDFTLGERIPTDTATYEFYKQYALQKKAAPPQQPAPQHFASASTRTPAPAYLAPNTPTKAQPAPQQPMTSIAPLQTTKPTAAPAKEKAAPAHSKAPSNHIELEPLRNAVETDLNDIHAIIVERFPKQVILSDIPSDATARSINNAWTQETQIPDILVLSFGEPHLHHAFLQNLSNAISIRIAPSALIVAEKLSQEKDWDAVLKTKNLKFVIAAGNGLQATPDLQKHYKEAQKLAKHYLGQVPLYMLSDIGNYLKNPSLKVSLWNDLCSMHKSL